MPNLHWTTQDAININYVDLHLSCLLHFNSDLATIHHYIGGKHVGAHHNPDIILSHVSHLLTVDDTAHLHHILTDGSPALFNATGTQAEFQEFYHYGNHKSVATRSWKP